MLVCLVIMIKSSEVMRSTDTTHSAGAREDDEVDDYYLLLFVCLFSNLIF